MSRLLVGLVCILLSFLSYAEVNYAKQIIQPVAGGKALVYLPFQSDLNKDYTSTLEALYETYGENLTVLSDVEIPIISGQKVFSATVFDTNIFDNYIMKLNQYDFILFDSHGDDEGMSLGIPGYTRMYCNDNELINSQCAKLDVLGVTVKGVHSSREDFLQVVNGVKVDLSINADFFTHNFTGKNKFKNTIFIAENCSNGDGELPEVMTSQEVGISLVTSWKGLLREQYTQATTLPYIRQLTIGKTSPESIQGLQTYFDPTKTVTIEEKRLFGLWSTEVEQVVITDTLQITVTKAEKIPDTHEVALYEERENMYILADKNILTPQSESLNPNGNADLLLNLVNTAHGKAVESSEIWIYRNKTFSPQNLSFDVFAEKVSDYGYEVKESDSERGDGSRTPRAIFMYVHFNSFHSSSYIEWSLDLSQYTERGTVVVVMPDEGDLSFFSFWGLIFNDFGIEIEDTRNDILLNANPEPIFSSVSDIPFPIEINGYRELSIENIQKNHVLMGQDGNPIFIQSFF